MRPSYNIVFLTGLSGTGKSTVGKILAEKLGAVFIDTDAEIERKTGQKIYEIFKKGERHFRFVESEVISDVIKGFGQSTGSIVVSLGGGAITLPENLHEVRKSGIVANLKGSPKILAERISSLKTKEIRPLLASGDVEKKLSELLKVRKKWYLIADIFVDTDGKSPEEVAEEIKSNLENIKKISIVRVNLGERSYDIVVGEDLLNSNYVREKIKNIFEDSQKVFVTTSRNIYYEIKYKDSAVGEVVEELFSSTGFEVFEFFLPEGETTKDIFYAVVLWEKLSEHDIKKNDFICILGGGVIGDLVGFVASTWLRGVKYVNVPTTLLSQVDSSIGGKTGVNTKIAKNMVGTIYQPSLVLCDINFINTLPESDFLSGLGEVLKYAISMSEYLFNFLSDKKNEVLSRNPLVLKEVVSECASLKADVVSTDEKEESGLRMVLNFGHTIAHAVESSFGYSIPHGIAVAFGMLVETKISDLITGNNLYKDVDEFVKSFGLGNLPSTSEKFDRKKFFDSMKLDKKTRGDEINFVLLERIGSAKIVPLKIGDFVKATEEVLKNHLNFF